MESQGKSNACMEILKFGGVTIVLQDPFQLRVTRVSPKEGFFSAAGRAMFYTPFERSTQELSLKMV